jgi:hypothetical protein
MKKFNFFKKSFLFLILYFIFLLPLACLAGEIGIVNPAPVEYSAEGIGIVTPGPDTSAIGNIYSCFLIFIIDFILNLIIVSICYLILREIVLIKSWKFLKYFFLVLGGCLLTNLISYSLIFFFEGFLLLTFELIIFLTFIIYNFWLPKKFFYFANKKSVFISLSLGIFTNIIISLFIYYFVYILIAIYFPTFFNFISKL